MVDILLGAGSKHDKRIRTPRGPDFIDLITVDINDDHNIDVVHDLNQHPWPFADDVAEEVHAYELMEHLGRQGDFAGFFRDWAEIWRILKPGGLFCGTSPMSSSPWAWGDPGHTRIISQECLVFLTQPEYVKQVGVTPMTDYRFCYEADFDVVFTQDQGGTHVYVLQAVKPSRIAT